MKTIYDAKFLILLDAQFGIFYYDESEEEIAKAKLKELKGYDDKFHYSLVEVKE